MRFLLVMLVACGATHAPRQPTTGSIAGLARDHDSGEPIAKAEITVRAPGGAPHRGVTAPNGAYTVEHLPPGRYALTGEFAGQTLSVPNIDVHAGALAVIDLTFTLGRPAEPGDAAAMDTAIDRYHPPHLANSVGILEGTVSDSLTRERVPGAVVTAQRDTEEGAIQAVTDDQGRFRFVDVTPGTYTVSAYYSIGGRGQIEVRRGEIAVAGGEGVIVPLWVELTKRD